MTTLTDIVEARQTYRNLIKTGGETALKQVFKDFFTKHPYVEEIYWTQYTPYFMDGEPCTFGVNDMYMKITDLNKAREVLDRRCTWETEYDYKNGKTTFVRPYEDGELAEALEENEWGEGLDISSALPGTTLAKDLNTIMVDNELYESVFGDHVIVRVTANRIETEHHEHE